MTRWMPQLRPMQPTDLPAVLAIEEAVFEDDAWPRSFFEDDLVNERSIYLVLELTGVGQEPARRELVGYAGYWLLDDEANLMNIALAPGWQGHGLGELLLVETLVAIHERGAETCTLEVRASNARAQKLYYKVGFRLLGRRRRYYQNNGEDALIMTTPVLDSLLTREWILTRRKAARAAFEYGLEL